MAKEMSFEQAIEGLQKCVHELEEGSLTLEETIKRYEEGKKLVQVCRTRLDNAKLRIMKLKEDTDDKEKSDGKEEADGKEGTDGKEDADGKEGTDGKEDADGKEDEDEDAAEDTKRSHNTM